MLKSATGINSLILNPLFLTNSAGCLTCLLGFPDDLLTYRTVQEVIMKIRLFISEVYVEIFCLRFARSYMPSTHLNLKILFPGHFHPRKGSIRQKVWYKICRNMTTSKPFLDLFRQPPVHVQRTSAR